MRISSKFDALNLALIMKNMKINRLISIRALICLLTCLFAFGLAFGWSSQSRAEGEMKLKIEDEGHPVWWGPAVSAQRLSFNYGGGSLNAGQEYATGTELAFRLYSSSNRTRTLFVGFDLRQMLAEEDGTSSIDYLGTKLGIRLEYRLPIKFQPSLTGAWFFGDTFINRTRNEQFIGNSGEVSLGFNTSTDFRWFLTFGIGTYNQGSGFIILNRQPGSDSANTQTFGVGLEWSIRSVWPEWLNMTPPKGPVNPF